MGGEGEVYSIAIDIDQNTLVYTKGGLSPYAGQPFKFQIQVLNY